MVTLSARSRELGLELDSALKALEDTRVDEWVLVERKRLNGSAMQVAFVVVRTADDAEKIIELLARLNSDMSVVPLWHLPFNEAGEVDFAALQTVPVRDRESEVEWEAKLAALPGVVRASAVAGPWIRSARRLHWSELFGEARGASSSVQVVSAATDFSSSPCEPIGPPAFCQGAALPDRGSDPLTIGDVLRSAPADRVIVYVGSD
jgi:hypothetical protein